MPLNEERTIYETAFIKERFLKRGLTVTALNNYLSCPVKYFYKNLVQIPSGYSGHMQYGHIVHGALEKFLLECKAKEEILPKERLLELFTVQMNYSSLRDQDKDKYLGRGLESLEAWYANRLPNMSFNIQSELSVKRDFLLSDNTVLNINGKIDKVEFLENEMEGPINIIDYKTGGGYSKKNKEQKEDLKRQLAFYHILLDGYKDDAYQIKTTALDFIEPNIKGECEFVSLSITEGDITELKGLVNATAFEIMSGEFLGKGCQKKDCEWCALHKNSQTK